jgi:uncharacterized protein
LSDIAIFGAGGRAGRAATAEAHRRGHRVTAVVRDRDRHRDLETDRVVEGDVTDTAAISAISRGHDAAVNAVSPASGPQALADLGALDPEFFVKVTDALLQGLTEASVPRLLMIGLFANLEDEQGRLLLADPSVFPAELRPFALAHTAGLNRLRESGTAVDWLMLTPSMLLSADNPRTGRYRLGGETHQVGAALSSADLAVAMIDEIETPKHHRTRISILGQGQGQGQGRG